MMCGFWKMALGFSELELLAFDGLIVATRI